MHVYLNNKLVPRAEALISVFDHGFLYGDGVYETMRAYDGVIFMLDDHLMRLHRSASMIGLTVPLDMNGIKDRLGVPKTLRSCHTAQVGKYIIEGHVPAEDLKRLLKERPSAAGLAAPGMPQSSPGMAMPGAPIQPYDVIAFQKDGTAWTYARH